MQAIDPSTSLAAIMAAHELKARYFRLLDTRRWDEWAALFADDAVLDASDDMVKHGLSPEQGIVRGRAQILAGTRRALDGTRSLHAGYMPEVDVVSHHHLRAIWGMTDHIEYADGRVLEGAGHYHDEYISVDGRWLIARSQLARLRLEWRTGTDG